MSQSRTHDRCKYFDSEKCLHKNDEIMKQATQTIPEYHGGKMSIMSLPSREKIDKICENCEMFTLK